MDKLVTGLPEPTSEPGVVAASVYAGGRRVADITVDEAGKWARSSSRRCVDRPVRAKL